MHLLDINVQRLDGSVITISNYNLLTHAILSLDGS